MCRRMVYYLNNNFLNCMIHNNASKITNDNKKFYMMRLVKYINLMGDWKKDLYFSKSYADNYIMYGISDKIIGLILKK